MAKWIYNGDCLITSCCNTAYDIDKFERKGEFIYLPCECPNCGARMIKEEVKKIPTADVQPVKHGRTSDIKITVKKSELEYCFKAENYAEFERRFNDLKDIMYQRFINAITKRDIMHIREYIINQNRGETK